MVSRINITQSMKTLAKERADLTLLNLKRLGKQQYTGITRENAFYDGYLGELVMLELLKQEGIQGAYRHRSDGVADNRPEFLINTPMGDREFDVKTATKPFHIRIMMPAKQLIAHDSQYYVGVRLCGEIGEIHGFCGKDQFQYKDDGFTTDHAPTYYMLLRDLKPIEQLWTPE